jgi:hypothetical protein
MSMLYTSETSQLQIFKIVKSLKSQLKNFTSSETPNHASKASKSGSKFRVIFWARFKDQDSGPNIYSVWRQFQNHGHYLGYVYRVKHRVMTKT